MKYNERPRDLNIIWLYFLCTGYIISH